MSRRRGTRLVLTLSLIATAMLIPTGALARKPAPPCPSGVAGHGLHAQPGGQQRQSEPGRQQGRDYAALNSQRVTVELANLDGSGFLRGSWATVVTETGDPAFETDCTYFYTRHDDRFEQVMAYYWVTQSQLYTALAGLRRVRRWPEINADQQRVRINQWGLDNSFATDPSAATRCASARAASMTPRTRT